MDFGTRAKNFPDASQTVIATETHASTGILPPKGDRVKRFIILPFAGKAVCREDFSSLDLLAAPEGRIKVRDHVVFCMLSTTWMRTVLFTRLPCGIPYQAPAAGCFPV